MIANRYYCLFLYILILNLKCSGTVSTQELLNGSFIVQPAPLFIVPRNASVQINNQIAFSATGGSPPYTFEISIGAGSIVPGTSVFLAPAVTGTSAVIVTDKKGSRDVAIISIVPSLGCPAGYILVPANSSVGTNADFCVAKYEMKCASDATGLACSSPAISQASNRPWVNIAQTDAMTECSGLGSRYHLITNPEWMTIARNIEANGLNWSTGTVNAGGMNTGHTDSLPNNTLAANTDDKNCFGTGQGSADVCATWNLQVRTHKLSGGEVIWDFGGNASEWIDWQVTQPQKAYVAADGGPIFAYREWTAVDANIAIGSTMEPKTWRSSNAALNSTNGIGQYISDTGTGSATRSGNFNDTNVAGIYMLSVAEAPTNLFNYLGFRCAFQ